MIDVPIYIDYIALAPAKARARRTDPQTSHDAAKRVEQGKAEFQRHDIISCINRYGGCTMLEVQNYIGWPKHELLKRVGEVAGIAPTGEKRNGFRVWGLIN
jgi:hypothetical protein